MSAAIPPERGREDAPKLPPSTHLGAVYLRVHDLERAAAFYSQVLGLEQQEHGPDHALFGAGGRALVGLLEAPTAPAPRRAPGLYHLALLLPDRAQLGAFLQHAVNNNARLQGASDHGVSEAIYLADPEGNGVEVYRDRPRDEWVVNNGNVEMITAPLDAGAVLEAGVGMRGPFTAPAGTSLGHVHLKVSSIAAARAHYHGVVGLDVTHAGVPGALFTSAGGYHHHVGLNTWSTAGAHAPEPGALGLAWFELVVPDAAGRAALEERLAGASSVRENEHAAFLARVHYEADGIGLAVTVSSGPAHSAP